MFTHFELNVLTLLQHRDTLDVIENMSQRWHTLFDEVYLDDALREALLNEDGEEIRRILQSRAPPLYQRREIIWSLRPFVEFFKFARDTVMQLFSIL